MSRSFVNVAKATVVLLVALPPVATSADQPESPGNSGNGGNGQGANQPGPYDPHGVGLPSGNGKSEHNNGKRPCAGCVGKADDKNPPGQLPGGHDPNKGYECDENQGVGKTNPAHSGCGAASAPTPPGGGPPGGGPPGGGPPGGGPPGGGPPGGGPPGGPPGPPGGPGPEPTAQPNPPAGPPGQGGAPTQEPGDVLGQQEAGGEQGAPEEGVPDEADQPRVVPSEGASEDTLPFTGHRLLLYLFLGALCLGSGVGIGRRLLPNQRG